MPRVRRCRYPGCHAMVKYPHHYCKQHFEHEAEYLASRMKWARSRQKSYVHRYNTVTRNRNKVKQDQYNFYRTKQWQDLRQMVLGRDNFVCRYCQTIGRIVPSKTVDHIVPLEVAPNKKVDISNLATICGKCHRLKTDWEQRYYGTGQGHQRKRVPEINSIKKIVLLMHEKN